MKKKTIVLTALLLADSDQLVTVESDGAKPKPVQLRKGVVMEIKL